MFQSCCLQGKCRATAGVLFEVCQLDEESTVHNQHQYSLPETQKPEVPLSRPESCALPRQPRDPRKPTYACCHLLTFVVSLFYCLTSHCFTVNRENHFVSLCNAGMEATVLMLYNVVKWDDRYWALGATSRKVARYRLGTGQPTWQNLRKPKLWHDPLRVDTRSSLREALCAEETEAGSGGAASELDGVLPLLEPRGQSTSLETWASIYLPRPTSCIFKSQKEVRQHFCCRDSERSLLLKGSHQSCTVQL